MTKAKPSAEQFSLPVESAIRLKCQSELENLEVVGLSAPAPLDIEDPMEARSLGFREPVNSGRATENYERLRETLAGWGIKVAELTDYMTREERQISDKLVNRIYVRDVAGVLGETLILGLAGTSVREKEFQLSQTALRRLASPRETLSSTVHFASSVEFGDVVIMDENTLLVNVGFRTGKPSATELISLFVRCGFERCALISLPRSIETAHLDLTCNIVGGSTFVASHSLLKLDVRLFSEGRPERSLSLLDFVTKQGFKVLRLPPGSDSRSCTNFVNLDSKTVLMSSAAKSLSKTFSRSGLEVVSVDIAELEKGGGGVRCLTLPLRRSQSRPIKES